MTTRGIERRLHALEAASQAEQVRNTRPRFLIELHDAADGYDLGVVESFWLDGDDGDCEAKCY